MVSTKLHASSVPSRKLNVVQIITFLPTGGVENLLLNTLPQIDKARFNVKVCCTYRKGDLAENMEKAGIPVHVCRVRSRFHPLDLWKLARWLKREKTDIVHTHMYASNITGTLAAKMARVPVIISHIHSTHEWTSRNRIRMERMCDRFKNAYVTVSGHVKEVFLQKTGLNCADKIKVVPNIAKVFDPKKSNPELLRKEFDIPSECSVVGTVARSRCLSPCGSGNCPNFSSHSFYYCWRWKRKSDPAKTQQRFANLG